MPANYEMEKKVIKNLLLTCKRAVNVNFIKTLYEQNTGNSMPFLELGFASVENFLLSMKDVIVARYSYDGSLILSGRVDHFTEHIKKLVDHQKSVKSKLIPVKRKGSSNHFKGMAQHNVDNKWPNQVIHKSKCKPMEVQAQQRLKALINVHPEGLSAHELGLLYIKEYSSYKSDLDFKGQGFNSLEELFMSCDYDTFYVKGLSRERFFYPKIPIDSCSVSRSFHSSTEDKDAWDVKKFRNKFPDVENFGVKAEEQYLTYNLELFNYFTSVSIEVGEVYSPLNFYILIQGEPYAEALDKLSAEMTNFYIEKDNILRWRLNAIDVVYEQPVVAFHEQDRSLYRGIITGMKGINEAEVYLIDYGANYKVQRGNLLYLHRNFFDLPAQAINARLHELNFPKTKSLSVESTSRRMLELVLMKQSLCVHIKSVDVENYSLSVVLIDESCPDTSINKVLLNEGYLVSSVTESISSSSSDWPSKIVKEVDALNNLSGVDHALNKLSCEDHHPSMNILSCGKNHSLNNLSEEAHRPSMNNISGEVNPSLNSPSGEAHQTSLKNVSGEADPFLKSFNGEDHSNSNNLSFKGYPLKNYSSEGHHPSATDDETSTIYDTEKLSTSESEESEVVKCVVLKGIPVRNEEKKVSAQELISDKDENVVVPPQVNHLGDALLNLRKASHCIGTKKDEVFSKLRKNPSLKQPFIDLATMEANIITMEAEVERFMAKEMNS